MDARSIREDVVLALQLVWLVLGSVAVLAALLPWALPHEALSTVVPACPARNHGGCPACGLTTAFFYMASGDLGGAAAANPLGPALYALALVHVPIIGRLIVAVSRRFSYAGL